LVGYIFARRLSFAKSAGIRLSASKSLPYRGFRYRAEIISHIVWLYFRFALSFRDIEELMASLGIIVTYETIRQWTLKFGQRYANELRRRQPQHGDKWHLDEVVLSKCQEIIVKL